MLEDSYRGNRREVDVLAEYYTWEEVRKNLQIDNHELFVLCNDGILSPKNWLAILHEEKTEPEGADIYIDMDTGTLSYSLGFLESFETIANENLQGKIFSCEFKRKDINDYILGKFFQHQNLTDYNYWYKSDLWTFRETVLLLYNIDPGSVPTQGQGFSSHKAGYPWFKEKTLSEFGLNPDDHEVPENLNLLFAIYESGNDRDLLFKSIDGFEDLPGKIMIIPSAVINYLHNRKDVTIPDKLKPLGNIPYNKTDDSTPQAIEPKQEKFTKSCESSPSSEKLKVKAFNVPPDTEWCDIRIRFMNDKEVKLTLGKNRTVERNYKSMGFEDKVKNCPNKSWMLLFEMAITNGDPKSSSKYLVKKVSVLQTKLEEIFPGVSGKPFNRHIPGLGWPPRIGLTLQSNIADQYTANIYPKNRHDRKKS